MECPSFSADLVVCAKSVLGLWVFSVWTWRLRLETSFRAEGSQNLPQEFLKYGYPLWLMKIVGACKLTCVSMLIASMLYPNRLLTLAGAGGIILFMMVAVVSHIKVRDPISNSFAAQTMGALATFVLLAELYGCTGVPPYGRCIGGAVAVSCAYMWLRSFIRGDYTVTENGYDLDYKLIQA